MIPVRMDFPTWRNADYLEDLPVTIGSVPVDLTNNIIQMDIRPYPTSPNILKSLTMVDAGQEGINLGDPTDGIISLIIKRGTLQNIYSTMNPSVISNDIVNVSYDLIVTYSDGLRDIYAQGIILINPGVSVHA